MSRITEEVVEKYASKYDLVKNDGNWQGEIDIEQLTLMIRELVSGEPAIFMDS